MRTPRLPCLQQQREEGEDPPSPVIIQTHDEHDVRTLKIKTATRTINDTRIRSTPWAQAYSGLNHSLKA